MNNVYIITGATGGMGRSLASKFKNQGSLLLCDLNENSLLELQKELGGNTQFIVGNVAEDETLNLIYEKTKQMGTLKAIIHFAGVSENYGDASKIMELNLIGTAKLMNTMEPLITKGTVIINTASMTSYSSPADEEVVTILSNPLDEHFLDNISKYTNNDVDFAYALSKKGIILLSSTLAPKLGKKGGRIISISPGVIKTPMVEREMAKNSDTINQLVSITPVGRIGTPKDITNLISFLCSDEASFITGTDILIDGGVTAVFKQMTNSN